MEGIGGSSSLQVLYSIMEWLKGNTTSIGNSLAIEQWKPSGKELLKATVGMLLVNGTVSLLYQGSSFLLDEIRSKFFVTLEITNKDESFQWIVEWLSQQPVSARASHVTLASTYDSEHGNNAMNIRPKVLLTPSVGSNLITFRGKWIWLSRARYTNAVDFASGLFLETISISTFGKNRKQIDALIQEAMDVAFSKEEGKTVIWSGSDGSWRKFGGPRTQRPLESVLLEDGIKEKVIEDIEEFLKNAKWYRDMGIPYRRGYLFHGYPGSGKTSFILALAGKFHMNICMVSLSDKDMSDDQLNHLLNSAPPRSIILLEDIDAAFQQRDAQHVNRVTFSGLLNALDGVAAQEGKLVFMTTNHVDKLDPALVRPGRIDFGCYFGLAKSYQIRALFKRFFVEETDESAAQFANQIPEQTITMAELQGFLLQYKNSAQAAKDNVASFLSVAAKKPNKERELKLF